MNFRIVSLPAMSLLFALVLSCGSSRSDEKRPPAAEQTKGEENASGDQKPDIVDDKGPTSGVNACGSGKAVPTDKERKATAAIIPWKRRAVDLNAQVSAPRKTFAYAEIPGVDSNLLSLDVYTNGGTNKPVLVFVHGGGWKEEDKINFGKAGSAIPYLQELGMVVVAVNFRLWPEFDYAVQTCDIANAIKWVHDHIAEHGGDPKSVSLMGHSSGAHLASLIGIDASYLQAYGLTPAYLRSTILIDTVTYDMPRALETAPSLGYPESVDALQYIFSKRPEVHLDASTVTHAKAGLSYAPFLIISAGDKGGVQQQLTKDQANVLAKSLKSVGVDAAAHHVQNESHTSLVQKLGESSHEPTRLIGEFLKKHGI